uniref:PNPLA domain-containing protein n=1 Tax=Haptolina brevifila TaxID=156173 RepID=A0A7S2BAL4_9EUKA|mmetsp:Transcript_11171/g.22568  ORF Transcript_11171/g.22568 Transcript_11171/m.22568 type:complete len:392 (+) Transcript_11171:36-1211(+)
MRAPPTLQGQRQTWSPPVPKVAATLGWGLLFLQQRGMSRLEAETCHESANSIVPHSAKDAPAGPLQPRRQRDAEERPLNILSLDGGGIKGRNQMVMIEELEAATGRSVAHQFDLIGGTSIGGCGALFIAHFSDAATAKARVAMSELQHRCFASTSKRRLLVDGHFCSDQRRAFMMDCVGPRKLSVHSPGAPKAFALASCRGKRGLEPFLLRTYPHRRAVLAGTHRAKLSQAVEATSAAPFMFPRARLGGTVLADGGMIANDPTLVALQEASALWPGRTVGLVVSLGTGETGGVDRFDGDGASIEDWAPEGGGREGADARREILRLEKVERAVHARGGRYFRFQPPVTGVSPIEVDESRLSRMEAASREYFKSCRATTALCQLLSKDLPRGR